MMKAKAEAEAKEMQAKGLKRGEDFVDCESPLCFVYACPARIVCCTSLPSGSLGDFKVSALPAFTRSMPNSPLLPAPQDDLV